MTFAELQINEGDPISSWQWDANWEERVDGVGQFSAVIQDRPPFTDVEYGRGTIINDPGDEGFAGAKTSWGWRDIVRLTVGSMNLYHGEVVHSKLDLPAGHRYRRWRISGTDFNTIMDTRLVGVPDGSDWITIDGGQTHEPVDPNAKGLSRDGATVQALFAQYVELPKFAMPGGGFGTFGTSTFVHNWIPQRVMIDPSTGESRLRWTQSTLRSSLDEMRQLAGFPLFCWVDPDDEVHWEAFQSPEINATGGLTLLRPRVPHTRLAPATLSDDPLAVNGSTVVGFRKLFVEYDATYMPQQQYINGVTDFLYNGGSTIYQGTGWPVRTSGRRNQVPHFRQIMVDGEAVTDAEKSALARAYGNYARRARIRGSVEVGALDEAVDGWRCGQLLRIYDARLPPHLYGRAFPIQRVAGSLVAGNEFRKYTLEFGDYPIARFSAKYRATPQRIGTARLPARKHRIYYPTTHLRPSTTYTLYSQMVDQSDKPVRRGGIPVTWSLRVLDRAGVVISTGSIVAISSVTDEHGRSAATLTTGSVTDLHYHAKCVTAAQ